MYFQALIILLLTIHQKEEDKGVSLKTINKKVSDGSKEEEIQAICKMRNHGFSNEEKLKALDEEYHNLIENNQHQKAEQIQMLYQFQAKIIASVGEFHFTFD